MAVAGILLVPGPAARGGGGSENVLVVVNPNSPNSLAIANAYVHLRKISPVSVFHLPLDPDQSIIPVETFRTAILRPILETIRQRQLTGQIDCVAYSSDFPWGIDVKADIKRYLDAQPADPKREWPKILTQRGSLTGLTYLWQPVMAADAEYMNLSSNRYARRTGGQEQKDPTIGFSGRLQFGAEHEIVESGGQSYLLSVQLGATAGKNRRGNTPVEVFSCLARSAAADGTRPAGTIYYADNGNVRSTVRAAVFPEAVRQLRELGVAATIVKENAPRDRTDVQGVTTGMSSFDWTKYYHSRILPGAIGDNLTSTGGYLSADGKQTALTEFIRCGAAGASGTVIEPYSIPAKFPSPMIHVHYARGCSLAEAFYQSVAAPYQLLIVGDPLCQPWARLPKVSLADPQPGAAVRGTVELKPSATLPEGEKLDHFELFVDGVLAGVQKPDGVFSLDTAARPDGEHEIRVVGVGPGPIHSRGRAIVPLRFANHGRAIEASASPATVDLGGSLAVEAKCPGAARIEIHQHHRLLGTIGGPSGRLEIKAAALGAGPVRLEVIGLFDDPSPRDRVLAPPISVTVQWPENRG